MSYVIRWLPSHLSFGGATIRVAAGIDEVELSRRHSHQHLEPVTREVLEALFVVPEGGAVGAAHPLPAWASRALGSAPSWAVETGPDGWRRTYRPPANVTHIAAADWDATPAEQIEELEWLGAIAPTVVVTRSMEQVLDGIETARASGAGVGVAESADACWLLVPATSSRVRLTAQRWWLAEKAVEAQRVG